MNKLQQFALFICFLFFHQALTAQGWIRAYGGSLEDKASSVIQTQDEGYLLLGDLKNPATGAEANWIKTDSLGIIEWTHERDNNFVNDLVLLSDNSSISIGTFSPASLVRKIFAVRLDDQGNEIWYQEYGGQANQNLAYDIKQSADGNFFIVGRNYSTTLSRYVGYLAKINDQGNLLWEQELSFHISGLRKGDWIEELPNNHLILSGEDNTDVLLAELDATGQEIWTQIYPTPDNLYYPDAIDKFSYPRKVIATPNGYCLLLNLEYLIEPFPGDPDPYPYFVETTQIILTDHNGQITFDSIFYFNTQVQDLILSSDNHLLFSTANNAGSHLSKMDLAGQVLWQTDFSFRAFYVSTYRINLKIFEKANSYTMLGYRYGPMQFAHLRTDLDGNIVDEKVSRLYNTSSYSNNHEKIMTTDQGFLWAGQAKSVDDPSNWQLSLVKMDQNGNIYTSTLAGNVFVDGNQDCLLDNSESKLEDWLVKAEGAQSFFTTTNSNGEYYMEIDTGSYLVSVVPKNDYWAFCDTASVAALNFTDALEKDFGGSPVVECPFLEVDVSTAFLRRCFPNVYTVRYCNTGTQTADNVKIEVEFDQYLDIDSSSLPIISQIDNVLSFDIGSVAIGDCDRFFVYTTVNCDSTFLGQTHCVEARITPDSFCVLPSSLWNGASIDLDAACQGDSVIFEIKNIGTGDMSAPLDYFIVVDDVILRTGNFQLEQGASQTVSEFAGGATLRMDAMQVDGHPGNSQPSATVEACASNSQANISIGFVTQFGEDDGDPFVSIDCQENIGAYDPNDKQGFPKGYGEQHFIEMNQDLEYLIRFQNTGTDTAFKVVVIDTLSPLLNLEGFREGSSSHPYELDISGNGILTFTFDNIMLPDSNVNQLASNGFIKFKIPQQVDNPIGTVIQNRAAIYFDFNEPVITNYTLHTIGDDFVPTIDHYTLSGNLRTLQAAPIENAAIPLSGFQNTEVSSLAGGNYQLTDLREGQDYTLRPEKNNHLTNGLTAYDLVLLSKHLLNIEELDHPLLRMAADLDRDVDITVLDLFLLRKVILNLVTELPNNQSWRFFHSTPLDPNNPNASNWEEMVTIEALSADTEVHFTGVKVGDLNQSADPNNLWTSEVRETEAPLVFQLENPLLKKGETYEMWFRAEDFQRITAYQFSLKFAVDALNFVGIEHGALNNLEEASFGLHQLSEGIITTAWFDTQTRPYPADEQLFAVSFKAKQTGRLSDFVQLSQQYTPPIAYNQQAIGLPITLAFKDQEYLGQFVAEVYPNPTQRTSQLNYQVYQSQEMTIVLYNAVGQVVETILAPELQTPGQYQYAIDLSHLPKGTYFVEIRSPHKKIQRRIIKI